MAKIENVYEETLLAAGSTSTIRLTDSYDRFVYIGSGALVGAITITTSGTPLKGHVLKIQWNCTFTAGGATVTILGNVLNAKYVGKSFITEAYYNGSSWDLHLMPDFYESSIIGTSHIVDGEVTAVKIQAGVLDTVKMTDNMNSQVMVAEVSFESGEQSTNAIIMPSDFVLDSITYQVIKALSATDAGTITPKINGSNVTLSSAISIPLSTIINTTATTTCTAANSGSAGDTLTLVAAKTTVGGKVRCTIQWRKDI